MQTFGRYEIISKLGRGGMSDVFLAYDPRFERQVALKVLPAAMLHEPGFRERFDREAKLIANLEHPAIIPVYDYGEFNGQPFLAMRLMQGGTLSDQISHAPLTLDEADRIVQRLCRALDKAHSKNIIHRDIKPQNILFDEDGQAYLGDFGIARLAEGTQTMTIVGTPNYMAPEQAHGRDLDKRTDIYQLGVVLFEMLTGKQPFDAPTPVALLHRHAYGDIPSIREINSNLPPACETVVERALAKEKEDRYQTAGELAKDFNAACQGHLISPIDPRALTVIERHPTPENRAVSPLIVGGGIIAGLVVLALMFFFYWAFRDTEPESPTPVAEMLPTMLSTDYSSDDNSGDQSPDAKLIAVALESILAETETAMLAIADTPVPSPTITPMPTSTNTPVTPVPSPTVTPMPTSTNTPKPSRTPTPKAKSWEDFPFEKGIIVVGAGYGSVAGAQEDASRYESHGYSPIIFFRKNDIRVVLTGWGSESEAAGALPGVQTINNQAYTRDLATWCPAHRVNENGYKCS